MHLDLQISPESGEVGGAWSGSGVGRELPLGFHGQLAGEVAHSLPPEGAIC